MKARFGPLVESGLSGAGFHRGAASFFMAFWKKSQYKSYLEVENPEYEVLLDDDEDADTAAIHTARRVRLSQAWRFQDSAVAFDLHHLLGRLEGELPELLPSDSIARTSLLAAMRPSDVRIFRPMMRR